MATNISSIHIQPSHIGEFFHNSREKPTKNSIGDKSKNYCNRKAIEAIEIYRKDLEEKSNLYYQKRKRKLPSNTKTLFSAIINLKEDSTIEDVKKVAEHLEKKLDVKIYQIAIHEDEGHIENGEFIKNRHAHIMFSGLDENAQSIKRNKLNIHFLRQLQNDVANILQMERGKERAVGERKRLDTYEYKKARKILEPETKDKEIEKLKISKKELEKEISELRKEMIKSQEFSKEDYQALSNIKKQLKGKNVNLNDIYEIFKEFERTIKNRIKNKIIQDIENTTFLTKNKAIEIVEKHTNTRKDVAKDFLNIVFKYKELEKKYQELKEENKRKDEEIFKKENEILKTKKFYKKYTDKLESELQKLYKQINKQNDYKQANRHIQQIQKEIKREIKTEPQTKKKYKDIRDI